MVTKHHDTPGSGHACSHTHSMGKLPRPAPDDPLSAAAGLCARTNGQAGGLIRLSGRTPKAGTPNHHLVAGAATRAPRTQVRLAAPNPGPGYHRLVTLPDRKAPT